MKKALLFLFTVLALFAFISCDNSVDYPFDDDIPAVETPEMVPLTFEFIKDGKIFNEIIRAGRSRKEFFNEIIDVISLLGGDASDAL